MRPVKLSNCNEYFFVDADDHEWVNQWKWRKDHHGYVCRNWHRGKNGQRTIFLHRKLIGAAEDIDVDHINRNPLDNRKSNLRQATRGENNVNSKLRADNKSGFTGVKQNPWGTWRSYITYQNKRIELGCYKTFEQALGIRITAELEYYGEFSQWT